MKRILQVLRRTMSAPTAVLVAALLLTGLIAARTALLTPERDPAEWAQPWDHHKYVYMSEHPLGSFHIDPTARRVVVPFLVSMTGLGPEHGFFLIAFISIWFTGVLLFHAFGAAGYSRTECWLGMLIYYSYGAATKLLLRGMYNPDAFHHLLIAAAVWLIYTRRDLVLAGVLALGAAVKETTILIPLLCYTLRTPRLLSFRHVVRAGVIFLAPLAVIVTLRVLIEARNDDSAYVEQMGRQLTEVHLGTAKHSLSDALARVGSVRLHTKLLDNIRELSTGSLGILFLLPFFALTRERRESSGSQDDPDQAPLPANMSNVELLLRAAPLYAAIYFAFWMSLNFDRRIALAFPFTIMMSLNGIRRLVTYLGTSTAVFFGVFAVQFLLLLAEPRTPVPPFDIAAAAFVLCLAVGVQIFRPPKYAGVSSAAC